MVGEGFKMIRKLSINAVFSLGVFAVIIWIMLDLYPLNGLFLIYLIGLDILNIVFWLVLPEILTNPYVDYEYIDESFWCN